MIAERTKTAQRSNFLHLLDVLTAIFLERQRIHNYIHHKHGIDYVFEVIDRGDRGYMTAYGKGVKQGDYILLLRDAVPTKYQIEKIDYYSNPSNLWIAVLHRTQSIQST